jgi:hypothetical protein
LNGAGAGRLPHAGCPPGEARANAGLEVVEVFRRHFEAYRHSHAPSREQLKVARDLRAYRTAALGGHLEVCTACGWKQPAYDKLP